MIILCFHCFPSQVVEDGLALDREIHFAELAYQVQPEYLERVAVHHRVRRIVVMDDLRMYTVSIEMKHRLEPSCHHDWSKVQFHRFRMWAIEGYYRRAPELVQDSLRVSAVKTDLLRHLLQPSVQEREAA